MIGCNNIKSNFSNNVLMVKIYGEIDHHNAKQLREKIDSLLIDKKPLKVILDLSSVSFMDSSGLGLIMGRYSLACELDAKFIIYNPNKKVKKILELSGIERIIEIKEDSNYAF